MIKYDIIFSDNFNEDVYELFYFISESYHSPLTAKRYIEGLLSEIEKLKRCADALPYCRNSSIKEKYGFFVKRINYKKIAILFIVENNNVYILKLISQASISDL